MVIYSLLSSYFSTFSFLKDLGLLLLHLYFCFFRSGLFKEMLRRKNSLPLPLFQLFYQQVSMCSLLKGFHLFFLWEF